MMSFRKPGLLKGTLDSWISLPSKESPSGTGQALAQALAGPKMVAKSSKNVKAEAGKLIGLENAQGLVALIRKELAQDWAKALLPLREDIAKLTETVNDAKTTANTAME